MPGKVPWVEYTGRQCLAEVKKVGGYRYHLAATSSERLYEVTLASCIGQPTVARDHQRNFVKSQRRLETRSGNPTHQVACLGQEWTFHDRPLLLTDQFAQLPWNPRF
jgi:hypothetical protein